MATAINNNLVKQYNDLLAENVRLENENKELRIKLDALSACVNESVVNYIKELQNQLKEKDKLLQEKDLKIKKMEESYKKSQETMRGQKKALERDYTYELNTITRERDKYKIEADQSKQIIIKYEKEIEELKKIIENKDIKIDKLTEDLMQREEDRQAVMSILRNTEIIIDMIEKMSNDMAVKTAAKTIKETIHEYKKSDEIKKADLEKSLRIAIDYVNNGYKTSKEMIEKYGYSSKSGLFNKIETIKKNYLHIVEAYMFTGESKETIQKRFGSQSKEILEVLDDIVSTNNDNIDNGENS